jgi:rhodanese-related sulfurtransferase
MTTQELREKLSKGENIKLIDVREGDEFVQGDKTEGAENIPMGKVFVKVQKGELPKEGKIMAICKTGGRCEVVARELRAKGYDIEHLEGGIDEWKKAQNS